MKPFHLIPLSLLATQGMAQQKPIEKPNILWIVSEDNSAYFTGCYGNSFATTPNIDKLAGQGFMYTHAYCSNAVCAPSRNTIITGVYSASNGHENMRSTYPRSVDVHTYPEYLRKAGYYCTNNNKTDYNTPDIIPAEIWDESSKKAHYRNRPKGKPFFAVFNIEISHESCLFKQIPTENLRHSPEKVTLPPYHPNTPEMRHDWAQYYDKIEDMDAQVGVLLKELEKSGEAENTIVMYYGDNGGVLARSKRFVYETGTRIPFILRIPAKYKYLYPAEESGQKVNRIINFVDFAPTLLSIAAIPVPAYMQGNAFLGKQKTQDPQYAFMSRQRMDERYDMVRAVRDNQFRYIRNYMPFRITLQHVNYLFKAPSARSWEDAFKAGKTDAVQSAPFLQKPLEELYDTENDPWEIKNLAGDPAYTVVLTKMRNAENDWRRKIRDVGLIPETEYKNFAKGKSMYDYMRSAECPFDELMKAADLATQGQKSNLKALVQYLKNRNSAIRFWGATGLLILKNDARPAIEAMEEASSDPSGAVAIRIAEALYGLGEKELARKIYSRILTGKETFDDDERSFALNSIDAVNENSPELKAIVAQLIKEQEGSDKSLENYGIRAAEGLLTKWGIK